MITPIIFNPIENNPYFWWNGLEIPIQLKYLFEQVQKHDITIKELVDAVNKFNEEFEETIKQEVVDKINEMYASGELESIIVETITDRINSALAPKEFNIDMARELRIALSSNTYNTTNFNEELYSFCQGGCVTPNWYEETNENSKYFIGAFVCSNSSPYKYNDNVDLRVYEWNTQYNTFDFIKHKVVSAGHGNSLAVDMVNHIIYLAPSQEYNGGTTAVDSNKLYKYDFDLNEIGVTKINELNKCSLVAVHNGDVYVSSDGNTLSIKKITAWGTITSGATVEDFVTLTVPVNHNPSYGLNGSGIAITNDFIFVSRTSPNGIYRYNRNANYQLDNFYNVGNFANNHMFPVGEVENLSVIGDVVYLGCTMKANPYLSYIDYHQMFSFNFVNNTKIPNEVYNSSGNAYRIIHVGQQGESISVDPERREICNPNGLEANAFPYMSEALIFANAQDIYSNIEIKCITRNLVEYLVIETNKNIVITGQSYYNDHSAETGANRYVHLGGLHIRNSNVSIIIAQIENRVPITLSNEFAKSQIWIRDSIVNTSSNVKFNVTGRDPDNNNLIDTNRAICNFGEFLDNNLESITFEQDENAYFYDSTINTHGHFTGSNSNVVG